MEVDGGRKGVSRWIILSNTYLNSWLKQDSSAQTSKRRHQAFGKIEAIKPNETKRGSLPILAKRDRFVLKEVEKKVVAWLKGLLALTEEEKQYLVQFSNGDYNPFLLFSSLIAERISHHPMAKWRASCTGKQKTLESFLNITKRFLKTNPLSNWRKRPVRISSGSPFVNRIKIPGIDQTRLFRSFRSLQSHKSMIRLSYLRWNGSIGLLH